MKRIFKQTIVAAVALFLAALNVQSQQAAFTDLHTFTDNDGNFHPYGGVVLAPFNNTLYGTTIVGHDDTGAIYSIRTDGSGLTFLHSFTRLVANEHTVGTNSDGAQPYAGLALSGKALFGTTQQGGTNGCGTIFKISTSGSFTTLHHFKASEGVYPCGPLLVIGFTVYGTAAKGGSSVSWNNEGYGSVFKINTDGTGFQVIHNFNLNDGLAPWGRLAYSTSGYLADGYGTVYGTTTGGPDSGGPNSGYYGTVFAMDTNGNHFSTIYNFQGGGVNDGQNPKTGVAVSGDGYTLYGTTASGGTGGGGTLFAISVSSNGTGTETILHNFSPLVDMYYDDYYGQWEQGNSDGCNPNGDIVLATYGSRPALYLTPSQGGYYDCGVVLLQFLDWPNPPVTLFNIGGRPETSPLNSPFAGVLFTTSPDGIFLYGTCSSGGSPAGSTGDVFKLAVW